MNPVSKLKIKKLQKIKKDRMRNDVIDIVKEIYSEGYMAAINKEETFADYADALIERILDDRT